MKWRVVDLETHSGPKNMAIDEMLARFGEFPTVRFYLWDPVAVSIGKHQLPEIVADQDIPIVRRATGGYAVYHGDLTYSVVAPLSLLSSENDAMQGLQKVLEVLRDGLNSFEGLEVKIDTHYDIITSEGKKIAGNAMRTITRPDGTTYLLVHGSIFLQTTSQQWAETIKLPVDQRDISKGYFTRKEAAQIYDDLMAKVGNYVSSTDLLGQVYQTLKEQFVGSDLLGAEVILTGYTKDELAHLPDLIGKYSQIDWDKDHPEDNVKREIGTGCAVDRPHRLYKRKESHDRNQTTL